MLSLAFSRALTASGFEHRATILTGGRVVYRLADGSAHVTLPFDEWQALGERFQAAAKPLVRRAFVATVCLLPGLVLYLIAMSILGGATGLRIFGWIASIGLLFGLFFGPLVIYLWQSYRIKRIGQAMEAELKRYPRVAAPPQVPSRPPRWLQIAGIFLIGPGIIIAMIGEFGGPDTFRNTPLTGTRMGPLAYAGLAVLAALLFYHLRARSRMPGSAPDAEEAEAGRKTDVIARARGHG